MPGLGSWLEYDDRARHDDPVGQSLTGQDSSASAVEHCQLPLLQSNGQRFIVRRDRLVLDTTGTDPRLTYSDRIGAQYWANYVSPKNAGPIITISNGVATANFPLLFGTEQWSLVGKDLHPMPYELVTIVVKVPFPRSCRSVYATRRTVQDFVSFLRAGPYLPSISLAFSVECRPILSPTHYEVLLGPFSRLTTTDWLAVERRHVIDPLTGDKYPLTSFGAEERRSIALISDAINESSFSVRAYKNMYHQQLILGMKMELLHVEATRQHLVETSGGDGDDTHRSRPFDVMRPSDVRRVAMAIADLSDFYDNRISRRQPYWLLFLDMAIALLDRPNTLVLRIMNRWLFPETPSNVVRDWFGGLLARQPLDCWTGIEVEW